MKTYERTGNSQVGLLKIYCAYTNPSDATLISLADQVIGDVEFVDCRDDKWAYVKHFQSIWDQGETAVNLEHDICFWPGAIESLTACPRAFCWFDDQWGLKESRKNYARFGLVKLSAYLISQTKDVWDDLLRRYEPLDPPSPWNMCDTFFFDYVRDHTEITPHEHTPGTINVNTTYYHGVISSIRQELSCSTG